MTNIDASQMSSQTIKGGLMHAYLFILILKLLVSDVQVHIELLIIVELAQDVGVVGLALPDGGIKGDDHHCLRYVAFGQDEQPHNGVVLYPVVLSLQSTALLLSNRPLLLVLSSHMKPVNVQDMLITLPYTCVMHARPHQA